MAKWTDLAQWAGPSANEGPGMVEYRGLVLHIMEGTLDGSVAWAKNAVSDVSFHFGVGRDGRVVQVVDTAVAAWTQGQGNGRWISAECEGYSGQSLTTQQIDALARLYAHGVQEYGWPLQPTDSTNGHGLGWHGMGGTAWGGHPNCPGEPIKAQRPAILAQAAQLTGGNPMLTPDQDKALWEGWASHTAMRYGTWAPEAAGKPTGDHWLVQTILDMYETLHDLSRKVTTGGVDYPKLAAAVVDELHRRTTPPSDVE